MSEAPAPISPLLEPYALAFMLMGQPPAPKFKTVDGGRRMLGERTPGRADLKLVKRENEQ